MLLSVLGCCPSSRNCEEIVTQKNDLELKVKAQGMTKTTRSRLPSTSLVNEGQVFGRDEDKKAIINLLLSGESGDAQLSVIPILGMAGLGKTTLAQLIYNEDNVDGYFDLKAWIHVSEDFDIVRVTKVILQSITRKTYDINDLNLLQVKLKYELFGQKFLLILDDVWNESYDYWTQLLVLLNLELQEVRLLSQLRMIVFHQHWAPLKLIS